MGLRGSRLKESAFLAALQHCESGAVERAAISRTLDSLDRVTEKVVNCCS